MNKIVGVYKITSPTGRVYIGESTNISKRWSMYKSNSNSRGQKLLNNSFKKYGVDNHTFEIIEECESDELKCRERYWQDFYDVLGEKGLNLNLTMCGELRYVASEETRKLISESQMGEKNHMFGKKGELHHLFGKRLTAEQKVEFKQMLKNRNTPKGALHKASVSVIDTLHNKVYGSIREMSNDLGLPYSTLVSKIARGTDERFKKHGNEVYTTPCPQKIKEKEDKPNKTRKKISEQTRLKMSISQMKREKRTEDFCINISNRQMGGDNPVAKLVLNTETGIFYLCIKEAADTFNINISTLSAMLNGRYRNKTSLILC